MSPPKLESHSTLKQSTQPHNLKGQNTSCKKKDEELTSMSHRSDQGLLSNFGGDRVRLPDL